MLKPNLTIRKAQKDKLEGNSEKRLNLALLPPDDEHALAWATALPKETAFLVATTKILSAIQDHNGLQLLSQFTKALWESVANPARQASFHAQHSFVENHLTGQWHHLREAGVLSSEQLTLLFDLAAGEVPPLCPENHSRLTPEEQWALTLVWIIRQAEQAYDQLKGADNDMILDFLMHIHQLLREISHPLLLEWKKLPLYSEPRELGE